MNNVFSITDSCEKMRIAREILEALPEWFGIPEARENYIKNSADQLFFTCKNIYHSAFRQFIKEFMTETQHFHSLFQCHNTAYNSRTVFTAAVPHENIRSDSKMNKCSCHGIAD